MKCEFCGFEGNCEIEVYDYERYNGMKLCDRCVDKFDIINKGFDHENTWSDEYSDRYDLEPFPIKETIPTCNIENQVYGRRR